MQTATAILHRWCTAGAIFSPELCSTPRGCVGISGRIAVLKPAPTPDRKGWEGRHVTVRLSNISNGSVRKELVALKHLYRLACGEWKLLPRFANPTLDVTSPQVRDERTQHLSPDQCRRFLSASPEKMKPIFAPVNCNRNAPLRIAWLQVGLGGANENPVTHKQEWHAEGNSPERIRPKGAAIHSPWQPR